MRRVDITGIALEANTGAPLVVLREQDQPHRLLPIFIGAPEASAIAIAATGQRPPVPMVHDVMAAVVAALDGHVEAIEVTGLQQGAFSASINLVGPDGTRRVGSRPSDAIALAVRTGAPVFVSDEVLDVAGTLPSADGTDPDPAAIDSVVDSFRSFLETVEPTDFIDTDLADTDQTDTDPADDDQTDDDPAE